MLGEAASSLPLAGRFQIIYISPILLAGNQGAGDKRSFSEHCCVRKQCLEMHSLTVTLGGASLGPTLMQREGRAKADPKEQANEQAEIYDSNILLCRITNVLIVEAI